MFVTCVLVTNCECRSTSQDASSKYLGFPNSLFFGSFFEVPISPQDTHQLQPRQCLCRLPRRQEAATSVRVTGCKCLHKNIAGKHCQQCFLSNSAVTGAPARRQMPAAKKYDFFYTFANPAPEISQLQNQTHMFENTPPRNRV